MVLETIKLDLNVVAVKWIDASSDASKFTQEQINQMAPLIVFTSGFLVRHDKKMTILAQSFFKHTNKFESLMIIPSSLILEILPKEKGE